MDVQFALKFLNWLPVTLYKLKHFCSIQRRIQELKDRVPDYAVFIVLYQYIYAIMLSCLTILFRFNLY